MTRVLYDSHTLLQGLLNPHPPYSKLFAFPDEVVLLVSDTVAEEVFKTVLQSASLKETLPALDQITLDGLSSFVTDPKILSIPQDLDIDIDICQDAKDNEFLVSALGLEADCLVTAVPDLLALQTNQNWAKFCEERSISIQIVDVPTFTGLF